MLQKKPLFFILGVLILSNVGRADESYSTAHIAIVNKITGNKAKIIALPLGKLLQYESLKLNLEKCFQDDNSEFKAFIDIYLQKNSLDKGKEKNVSNSHFAGWFLSEHKALSIFENAIYDIQLIDCTDEKGE